MTDMLIITLREGIEAFLIVAIAAAYLRKTGREALLPAVWAGTAVALAISVVVGGWLLDVAPQPVYEGALAAVAAVLVHASTPRRSSPVAGPGSGCSCSWS